MSYTLTQAAEAAKVQRSTVFKWIKAGKVSATKADDGTFRIEPAELHRFLDRGNDLGGNGKTTGSGLSGRVGHGAGTRSPSFAGREAATCPRHRARAGAGIARGP